MIVSLLLGCGMFGTVVHAEVSPVPRMVFAHYMVCCPASGSGATVDDFKREIQTAQSYGIDGFVLNMPSWLREPIYRAISQRIFAAAEASPLSFKLFVSFDDVSVEDTVSMLTELSRSPAYLRIDNRPVVSTFSGVPEWGSSLSQRLSSLGLKPFLVPNYQYLSGASWARNYSHPTAEFLDRLYREHPEMDGYFNFGPDLGHASPPSDGRLVAQRSRIAGKISMIGISPYYRGLSHNYRVFESGGFEGMAAQWTAAIESGANLVEIVTWNDWGESTYVAPFGDIRQQDLWNYHWGPLLSHEAFLSASRYFIAWFKSSAPPVIQHPAIYYFYRLHSKFAHGIASAETGEQGRPKGWESLVDGIYVTAFLPRTLTVEVAVGERRQSATLPPGIQHHRFELAEGPVAIQIREDGRVIGQKELEFPITKLGQIGNFNYFGGDIRLP
ncbi:endo-1,3-alpha-glucanase family glycosylhydrolase [Bradyrhizobium sp. BR 10261]|uniref:endo-1,3-alpha-glucanase family glycosylhydrolase n=1 Tax=Bradyrhizobium sp. BR 10261 TaxID=2749992 RepID=UPI001C64EFE3|nr:endo-1,3-alpha-glucanase family glycosylhydrolase [Bradyrhizobium sp. BR 10261]MBW7961790.1 hypothetical protein [Bradyrhizobium sp. BR 10261]